MAEKPAGSFSLIVSVEGDMVALWCSDCGRQVTREAFPSRVAAARIGLHSAAHVDRITGKIKSRHSE